MILVTGGAGFVGSNIAIRLKMEYPTEIVTSLDNLNRRGSELNLSRLKSNGVDFIHGDVRNKVDLNLKDVRWIIDCSAEASAQSGRGSDTDYLVHTNLLGTYNCLELARKHNSSMIYLSTSRIYPFVPLQQLIFNRKNLDELEYSFKVSGSDTQSRFQLQENQNILGVSLAGVSENFPLAGPRTLYGATKLASELLIAEYVDSFDLAIVINRCGVLTGPWQMGQVEQGVVVLWMSQHIFGGNLSYFGYGGRGMQVRDILHVQDLVDLVSLQIRNISEHRGKTYNVGGGTKNSISLRELTAWCEKLSGNTISITPEKNEIPGDIPWFITDSTKVMQEANWSPQRNLEKIMVEIYDWIVEYKDLLRPILS